MCPERHSARKSSCFFFAMKVCTHRVHTLDVPSSACCQAMGVYLSTHYDSLRMMTLSTWSYLRTYLLGFLRLQHLKVVVAETVAYARCIC